MGAADDEYLKLHPESGNVNPLPSVLRSGLIAVSVFALLSFILASTLFLYLAFKLVYWHYRKRRHAHSIARNIPDPQPVADFTFEDGNYGSQDDSNKLAHDQSVRYIEAAKHNPPNQFLILIFNLIIADMHQSAAFLLSASWLQKGGIFVKTPTCFVQGFFDSNGDLSSSLFITAIAIHTHLSVVNGYRPPQNVLYAAVIGIWIFVYSLSVIPLLATHNGRHVGGYFVRAGPWCWINEEYEKLRLLTHYLFIFLSLVTTTSLYLSIYISLRQQARQKAEAQPKTDSEVKSRHQPAFLVYPIIYVICTIPLALGRIATMAGATVPLGYYCFAGTLIASNGFFDCLLFGMTRHTIVFSSANNIGDEDTGLQTFAFMRTPAGRFGNAIWIEGGNTETKAVGVGGWWHKLSGFGHSTAKMTQLRTRTGSQESLRGTDQNDLAIQMEVVTSVKVEIDEEKERDPRFPDPLRSVTPSIDSREKDTRRVI